MLRGSYIVIGGSGGRAYILRVAYFLKFHNDLKMSILRNQTTLLKIEQIPIKCTTFKKTSNS